MSISASGRVFPVTRFPPDKPLEWTARTKSPLVQDLVRRREAIFDKQREADDAALQSRSDQLAVANLSTGHRADRAALAAYKRFCVLASIPPYPFTHALILLALYALCSAQDGPNRTFRTVLQRISAATAAVWTAQPVYDELRALDDDGEALSAFARERPKDKSKRASRILSNIARSTIESPRTSRRPRPSYVGQDQLYESSDSGLSESGSDESDDDDPPNFTQLPVPGMPQPGDQFSSSESAEQAVIRALVPVYGYSTRTKYDSSTYRKMYCIRNHGYYSDSVEGTCSFAVVVEKDSSSGRWVVNGALSTYEHTHGPHPKLVANPSWRPMIHKTVALEALGMNSSSTGTGSRKRKLVEMFSCSGDDDDGDNLDKRGAGEGEMSKRGVKRSSSPCRARPARQQDRARPSGSAQKADVYKRNHQPRRPLPPRPLPSFDPSILALPQRARTAAHDIEHFLHVLGPSLAPLAPHLAAAGIDSVDGLVALVSLEPATLDRLIDDLRVAVHPLAETRPSVVQLKLFKKRLEEARVGLGRVMQGRRSM